MKMIVHTQWERQLLTLIVSMTNKHCHRVTESIAQANVGEIIQANVTQQKIYPGKSVGMTIIVKILISC